MFKTGTNYIVCPIIYACVHPCDSMKRPPHSKMTSSLKDWNISQVNLGSRQNEERGENKNFTIYSPLQKGKWRVESRVWPIEFKIGFHLWMEQQWMSPSIFISTKDFGCSVCRYLASVKKRKALVDELEPMRRIWDLRYRSPIVSRFVLATNSLAKMKAKKDKLWLA